MTMISAPKHGLLSRLRHFYFMGNVKKQHLGEQKEATAVAFT